MRASPELAVPAAAAPVPALRPLAAILCMIGGTLLLTTQDAFSKWLTARFGAAEILAYRGLWAFLPLLAWAWLAGRRRGGRMMPVWRAAQPAGNVMRGVLNTASGLLVITAYAYMPLADAMAILFASPLFVTALSVPLLRERVGWRRWAAVLVGFAGVLAMVGPSGGGALAWAAVLPLLAMVSTGVRDMLTRRLGQGDRAATILFYTMAVNVVLGLATLPVTGATWPTAREWAVFAGLGMVNALSHVLVIRAFVLAPASLVAPFRYLSLVWAAAIGWAVWGDVPGPAKAVGAVLVVASGLYVARREALGRAPR